MKNMRFDDSMLDSPSQEKIRQLVETLPEDSLSLAWRSSLNEKLMVSAKVARRKRLISWGLRPALGIAVAGALAFAFLVRPTAGPSATNVSKDAGIEAALVQDHLRNVEVSDAVGAGLNPLESRRTPGYYAETTDWSEVDLDSL